MSIKLMITDPSQDNIRPTRIQLPQSNGFQWELMPWQERTDVFDDRDNKGNKGTHRFSVN